MPKISRKIQRIGNENAFYIVTELEKIELTNPHWAIGFHIGAPDYRTPPNVKKSNKGCYR